MKKTRRIKSIRMMTRTRKKSSNERMMRQGLDSMLTVTMMQQESRIGVGSDARTKRKRHIMIY